MHKYLAIVPQPVEKICAEELSQISGVEQIQILPGMIFFNGPFEVLYRTNLWSRCATRILLVIAEFPCETTDELYEKALKIEWNEWIKVNKTFAVRTRGIFPSKIPSLFGGLRIKDAIVDQLRNKFGIRPNVDTTHPTFQIHAQFYQKDNVFQCVICLDSSGASLSYRGYRTYSSLAPIRENLAATILYMAGYPQMPQCTPVIDPFCGSGTFLIEAGLIALQQAPGLQREFAFQGWPLFDENRWQNLRNEALEMRRVSKEPFLFGFDQNIEAIQQSQYHATQSNIMASLELKQDELTNLKKPTEKIGILVCNPPYGKRLESEESLIPLYRKLGDIFKKQFSGWTAYVFTASIPLSHQIGLRPTKRHILFNGPLEGRLLEFKLY